MRYLLAFILSLFAFTALAVEPPKVTRADLTNMNGDPKTPVVSVCWEAPAEQPDSYEVQRKLFPYAWKAVGTGKGANTAWVDRHPAKRTAAYRVRAVHDGAKSKWSKTVKVIGVSK